MLLWKVMLTDVIRSDVEKDNTAYSCGTLTGEYVMLFNRLVDTDQISSITVNDVEYTLE